MQIGDVDMRTLLTLHQASERTGISHGTLRQQARKGVLAATMLGRQWVVTAEALADYMENHAGKHGFASARHPYHGQRIGGRRKTQ
jgi:excisionase family DNA binding protein